MINNIFFMVLCLIILTTNVFADNPKVCFFADEGYQGASICATQGLAVDNLSIEWNDRISSISVPPGMVVSVYKDINFSGGNLTFRENVDLFTSRQWADLNNTIRSFKVRSAACFYEYDDFLGDSICISGNERIDLYNETPGKLYNILHPLNDRISSVLLPPDTQAIIYENDGYNGDYFVLIESHSTSDLEKIGMNKNISSIRVSQYEYFLCDQRCVIKNNMTIPVQYAFGNYWNDKRIDLKQVLISFKLTSESDYSLAIGGGGLLKVKNNEIFFIHEESNNSTIFKISNQPSILSMLFSFNGGYVEIQCIESVEGQGSYFYPILSYLFDVNSTNIKFVINNANNSKPLIIDKVVMTVEKEQGRVERGFIGMASCWLIPLLNIYNYIIQGRCNQAERFVTDAYDFFSATDNKILQVSGTSKPLPRIEHNETFPAEMLLANFSTGSMGILIQINSDMNGKSLTVPAAALACKVSMKYEVLPHLRFRRELIPPCIDWTLDILTDFTLLFGGSIASWNAENFGRVIERIINSGDTGYAALDTATDARLIDSVRTYVAENIDNTALIKTAFDFSQLSYAGYLQYNEADVQPPQVVQQLPQGRYELALQNFHFVETVPRRQLQGEWVEQPDLFFDIEVITGTPQSTLTARQNVLPVVEGWHQLYRQALQSLTTVAEIENVANTNQHEGIDPIISAANLVSDVVQSWLRTSRDDYIYVIVRLSGEIVSMTMAVDINEFDVGIAGSLTTPNYVLHPMADGVIRGAGTAAIRALAHHLAQKGKRSLVSDVISQPSAIVKNKVGFQFINEL
ncbi:peptidase inhibitor family I36 protein [Yersinia pekkanenii]|uniref:Beta-gamma-crystallin n=1 Tax=Yersinia pekkanenii TaxID=1288385 RepID=A0A0T9NDV2_9GAMM|nr:peptidase inhibitor family I36 protein [Yersinia pekkanenii]CNH01341.1 beta-gamma-crystallin [Yersinia pekkanenii]CRY64049.1 beta-gamma-crystallin [Yersinia pekkanenii]